jgi:hypothetical protein
MAVFTISLCASARHGASGPKRHSVSPVGIVTFPGTSTRSIRLQQRMIERFAETDGQRAAVAPEMHL